MFNSPFGESVKNIETLVQNSDIIFVSDFFVEDYPGGAELTTEALIASSGEFNIAKVRSGDVSMDLLSKGVEKYWVFANFSNLNNELIPAIIANLKYSIIEYDFKYCKFRSPEKHATEAKENCDCHNQMVGKMVSAFFYGADSLFWMSENQKNVYESLFPFLKNKTSVVVSSVFSKEFFETVSELSATKKDDTYLIVGSTSWIKGVEDSVEYCKENNLKHKVSSNMSHREMLEQMARSKGLVFLPRGGDTCPRTVIEAKLLGCELILNDNVMHKDEPWFASDSAQSTLEWLMTGPSRFWSEMHRVLSRQPTISGYTTTLNCIKQNYPFEACIESLLGFCDQVVVVDGGSEDGTIDVIKEIAKNDERVLLHVQNRDWDSERFAVFDGLQKALARALCTGEFCWQQDSDEVVHEKDYSKVKELVKKMPKNMDLVALPVIEFWGKGEKVRIDVTPWKWRASRNKPHITHGIPANLRQFDEYGRLFSSPGTDGCDYIRSDTFEPIPFINFYSQDADNARQSALSGNTDALHHYGEWLQSVCSSLPVVMHYSWYDLSRKIKTYKDYWSKHWQSLYNITQEDTPENNMFFDKRWSEVSNKEIDDLAARLEDEMGGWIFHTKLDFNKPTPFLRIDRGTHPACIKEWTR